jgi:demethylmenaquinone methyltransferase/2-methoxy-6-polyprenyl-1,4-benzoquinol methylase
MTDVEICIQRSLEANPLREPVFREVIRSLELPVGSKGLDAGCGIGLQALLLAEAVGPVGHITGLDILPELLVYGEEHARKAGYSDRITFRQGDVNSLPFETDTFDWAWSADCIGYPAGELAPLLEELKRVARPGGQIILLGWTSQQLLPGYPVLEARLNATCSGYIPFFAGKNPELNFSRALRWFRAAGLEDAKARTFVGDVQAPLNPGERAALNSLFEMLWGMERPEAAPTEDWEEFRRLCTHGLQDFILDEDDYYAFFTYSVFQGRVR